MESLLDGERLDGVFGPFYSDIPLSSTCNTFFFFLFQSARAVQPTAAEKSLYCFSVVVVPLLHAIRLLLLFNDIEIYGKKKREIDTVQPNFISLKINQRLIKPSFI